MPSGSFWGFYRIRPGALDVFPSLASDRISPGFCSPLRYIPHHLHFPVDRFPSPPCPGFPSLSLPPSFPSSIHGIPASRLMLFFPLSPFSKEAPDVFVKPNPKYPGPLFPWRSPWREEAASSTFGCPPHPKGLSKSRGTPKAGSQSCFRNSQHRAPPKSLPTPLL